MITWEIIGSRGIPTLLPDVEADVTVTIGRRDYVSEDGGSVLTFRIPWRAIGTRLDIETGALVTLRLGISAFPASLLFQVTDVVVDDDVVAVTAVSPEFRRLAADRTADPGGTGSIDDAFRAAQSTLSTTVGFLLHPDAYAGPEGTWPPGYLGEFPRLAANATLFGRLRGARQFGGVGGEFTLYNAELAAIALPSGRTSITLDPSWIVRSPRSTRSVLNGANVITVRGTSVEEVRDTGLDSGIAQTISTILDNANDVEALADGYEEAWTDLDSSPSEGWLPLEVPVLLDEIQQDSGETWVDVALASLVTIDNNPNQPMTRVDVPVIPPDTDGGSWTFLPCYVEGVTLNLSRGASTASLYCVPELLLRRRDILDYIAADDIVMWFDPLRRSTITRTGSAVTSLGDLGTRALDTETVAGREPTWSTLNGRPALQFTGSYGTGSVMRTPTFTQGRPVTLFVVAKQTSIDTFIRGIMGTSSTSPQFDSRSLSGVPTWHMFNGQSLYGAPVDGDAHVHACHYDGASSEYYLDGTLYSSGPTGTRTWNSERVAIGATNISTWPPTSTHWQGFLGEFLLVDSSSGTVDIPAISWSLMQKWGIPK